MGNIAKLISGFILFVLGIIVAYETQVNNYQDFVLIIGLIISIAGIILIISYFVDSSADKTSNLIREFINDGDFDSFKSGFNNNVTDDNSDKPLKIRREFDDYEEEGFLQETEEPSFSKTSSYSSNNPKAVLNVRDDYDDYDDSVSFDNQLKFTPNYDKPSKVTRAPKKRKEKFFQDDLEYLNQEYDKSEEIRKALQESYEELDASPKSTTEPQEIPKEVKIDINNPDSLPVPKLLKSFVVCQGGIVSSQDAFEQLAIHVNKEIMLEIPSLNELSDRFLSHIPTIYSRLIIEDFDVSDISYMILVASLIKQGVHIKTIAKVNTINLITDDSHAMIISENSNNDIEFGAIYTDRNGISEIRATFEKTWEMAEELDESIILKYMEKGA